MPAQQGPRETDQVQLAVAAVRQEPRQRGQDRPVRPRQSRCLDLALERGDLMAQDEDLGILGAVGTGLHVSHGYRQMEHIDQAVHIAKPWKNRMLSQEIYIRSEFANSVVEPTSKAVGDRQ